MKNKLRFLPIVVSLILALLFVNLIWNYEERFNEVEKSYKEKMCINLSKNMSMQDFSTMMYNNDYITNKEDADFIAKQIVEKFKDGKELSTLSDLNKRIWQVSSGVIDSIGSQGFKDELKKSNKKLGVDEEYNKLKFSQLSNTIDVDGESNVGTIKVKVINKETKIDNSNWIEYIKCMFRGHTPCESVVVRLYENRLDSLGNPEFIIKSHIKTDSNGEAKFLHLDKTLSYSVLPIQEGFEYGASKGTVGSLEETNEDLELDFEFTEKERKVRLFFSANTLSNMKEDGVVTVRTPKEFQNELTLYIVCFFLAWWLLFFFIKRIDVVIWSSLMFLTGLCLLMMFSINDPLNDAMLGTDMALGVLVGIFLIFIISKVDFVKFYQNKYLLDFDIPIAFIKWFFMPFHIKTSALINILKESKYGKIYKSAVLVFLVILWLLFKWMDWVSITKLHSFVARNLDKLPKGSGYLILALILTALLWTPLGSAVGGMRVNLNIGFLFQPSEISKYLLIFFMAAFFCRKADIIINYSKPGNVNLLAEKMRMLLVLIVGLGTLMGLYLILGDMGPGLVISFAFIILYSIIKSKVDLENVSEDTKITRVLTCDLAMLVYGIISFALCLFVGNMFKIMGVACILWFVLWITWGYYRKKQLFESPILFNIILSIFIFGSDVASVVSDSLGDRFATRIEMCTNTWGQIPINGIEDDPGVNTQVAEGLWGIASGGFWGQGLGNGSPKFIPAFHTDMILESMGEQLGFIGIFLIVLLYAILLRRAVVLGYKTSHPFVFYLCLGISIVTAIQLIIIALGSTGIIPLTGITVPFLSKGNVSMILNLVAFGILLSISRNNITESEKVGVNMKQLEVAKYNYPVAILSVVYCIISLIIISTFFYYQVLDRNDTLIKPVYVMNSDGIPVIQYNPRINELVNKMKIGNIYDRNGLLLATSTKDSLNKLKGHNDYKEVKDRIASISKKRVKRYYPWGEHLYFMLGDANSRLYFSDDSKYARGYMAEARHLSELRGYDNKLYDDEGRAIKVDLMTDEYRPGRFYKNIYSNTIKNVQLRDFSALVPYLKKGVNSAKVNDFNERNEGYLVFGKITPKDVKLTIDAKLQTSLQNGLTKYLEENYPSLNLLRASVVVLDAKKGDLLASANYPLPDYKRLQEESEQKYYSDNRKSADWKAYTDMDLGLLNATAPGSTAKIMSSMAALKKEGISSTSLEYHIASEEKIFKSEPIGNLDMKMALRHSSNCYFINLVNDNNLYAELAEIYAQVGVNIYNNNPYKLLYEDPTEDFKNVVISKSEKCVGAYIKYKESGIKEKMNNKTGKPTEWSWAWGQNDIYATPVTMARVASAVVNEGEMPITRYTIDDDIEFIPLMDNSCAHKLVEYLKFTAKEHDKISNQSIGGKTGTPERTWYDKNKKKHIVNDGWYVCFIENAKVPNVNKKDKSYIESHPIAIAIRLERNFGGMSGRAVQLTKQVVFKTLNELGYIVYSN